MNLFLSDRVKQPTSSTCKHIVHFVTGSAIVEYELPIKCITHILGGGGSGGGGGGGIGDVIRSSGCRYC